MSQYDNQWNKKHRGKSELQQLQGLIKWKKKIPCEWEHKLGSKRWLTLSSIASTENRRMTTVPQEAYQNGPKLRHRGWEG